MLLACCLLSVTPRTFTRQSWAFAPYEEVLLRSRMAGSRDLVGLVNLSYFAEAKLL